MSQENVEVVRRALRAFDRDLDRVAEFWDPDIDWRAIEGAPDDIGVFAIHHTVAPRDPLPVNNDLALLPELQEQGGCQIADCLREHTRLLPRLIERCGRQNVDSLING